MSIADAGRACWDCKLHYGFWRPITAIRLAGEDGNPATEADPAWEPLLATPPYPDYTSGLNAMVGAADPGPDPGARHRPDRPDHDLPGDEHHPALRVPRPPSARTRSTPASGRASTSASRTWSGSTGGRTSPTGRSTATSGPDKPSGRGPAPPAPARGARCPCRAPTASGGPADPGAPPPWSARRRLPERLPPRPLDGAPRPLRQGHAAGQGNAGPGASGAAARPAVPIREPAGT